MNRKRLEKMKKIHAKGKWHFVFLRGVLFWGTGMGGFFTALTFLTSPPPRLKITLLSFLISYVGGFFWGLLTWREIVKKISNK